MAPPKSKRTKRQDSPDMDDDDEERLPYFVPEEGIDIEALALYARGILDREARVKTGVHPQRPEQKGFWIMSGIAVTREDIAAMIEDTRLWRKEENKGYYLDSDTAKRRLKIGRAAAAKERPMAQGRSKRETEDARNMPQPVSRASADNISLSAAAAYRQDSITSPIPRPASAQPIPPDNRRPAGQPYPGAPGYNVSTPSSPQYASATMSPTQYTSQSAFQYDQDSTPPPPYDAKRGGGSGHPTTTGTQGFQSLYATAGGPPPPGPPQQRRHGSG